MAATPKPGEGRTRKPPTNKPDTRPPAAQSKQPVQSRAGNGTIWLGAAALLLLTIAVYWQVSGFGFIRTDDELYVFNNSAVKGGLNWKTAIWAFTHSAVGNWHPLTMLSLMMDYQLAGSSSKWFHLENVALHLAGALALVLAMLRLTRSWWPSLFTGAVFALHPTHVESVAWVSARKDVLSGLFLGLTLLAYSRYCRRPGWVAYLSVLVCLALGLLSKPMLVSVPILLCLLDYWPLGRAGKPDKHKNWSAEFREKGPLFLLAGIFCIVTFLTQRGAGAVDTLASTSIKERLLNALVAYATYSGKFFWPAGLAGLYPFTRQALSWWQPLLAALFLSAVTMAVIRADRSRPYLLVGWLWFCISLIPVIGLVQVGPQSSADRYTYIPYIGLSIMLAWGVPEIFALRLSKYKRQVVAALAVAAVAAMAVLTWQYLPHWKDDICYWRRVVEIRPDFARAYYNLALAEGEQGNVNEAMRFYRRALEVDDRCTDANFGLANLLFAQGRLDEAVAHYEAELRSNPHQAGAHNNLGLLLSKRGKSVEAMQHYQAAIEADPENLDAIRNWALELLDKEDWQGARAKYDALLKLQPDDYDAHYHIASALAGQGRLEEAIAHLKSAMQIQPMNPAAPTGLGALLLQHGNTQEALNCFQNALNLDPTFADARYHLAEALNLLARQDEAVSAYRELLKTHPDHYWGHNDLGILLADLGKLDEAVAQFEAAIKINPTEEAARQNRAKVLSMRNLRPMPRKTGKQAHP